MTIAKEWISAAGEHPANVKGVFALCVPQSSKRDEEGWIVVMDIPYTRPLSRSIAHYISLSQFFNENYDQTKIICIHCIIL